MCGVLLMGGWIDVGTGLVVWGVMYSLCLHLVDVSLSYSNNITHSLSSVKFFLLLSRTFSVRIGQQGIKARGWSDPKPSILRCVTLDSRKDRLRLLCDRWVGEYPSEYQVALCVHCVAICECPFVIPLCPLQ